MVVLCINFLLEHRCFISDFYMGKTIIIKSHHGPILFYISYSIRFKGYVVVKDSTASLVVILKGSSSYCLFYFYFYF